MSMSEKPVLMVASADASPATDEDSSVEVSSASDDSVNHASPLVDVPLSFKIASILLVAAIGFGGHWSSGITGAMKTKLKKVGSSIVLQRASTYVPYLGSTHQQHPVRTSGRE